MIKHHLSFVVALLACCAAIGRSEIDPRGDRQAPALKASAVDGCGNRYTGLSNLLTPLLDSEEEGDYSLGTKSH